MSYVVEMLNITKRFGNLVANDNVTLQVKKEKSTRYWGKMVLVSRH